MLYALSNSLIYAHCTVTKVDEPPHFGGPGVAATEFKLCGAGVAPPVDTLNKIGQLMNLNEHCLLNLKCIKMFFRP